MLKKNLRWQRALLVWVGASGPAQVLSPLYNFDNNTIDLNQGEGFLLSSNVLYGVTAGGYAYGGGGGKKQRH